MSRTYVRYSERSNLTEAKVLDIRRLAREAGTSVRTLAEEFSVPKSTVHDILTGKTWSHVPNPVTVYKNYTIYPDGRVFSEKAAKFLSGKITKQGVLTVELTINGSKKTVTIASLVAKAFLKTTKQVVNFADNDSTNVHFTNLVVKR